MNLKFILDLNTNIAPKCVWNFTLYFGKQNVAFPSHMFVYATTPTKKTLKNNAWTWLHFNVEMLIYIGI